MLFNEIYSAYYNALAILINKAIDGELSAANASEFIKTETFRDSFVYILDAIHKEQWQLIRKDYKTPIKNHTQMPLTSLQKGFLKSISLDKRFLLFTDDKIEGLDDINPLYNEKDFYYFDLMNDGDPYDSPEYRKIFRTVLQALKEKRMIQITFIDGKGNHQRKLLTPRRLEYSQKDDKFRLLCVSKYKMTTVNLARIRSCELQDEYNSNILKPLFRNKACVTLEITDQRNALERCMLHFANYEKVTTQMDEIHYKMELTYCKEDEAEVLIRVLSFGPMIKVKSPDPFIQLIRERLMRQLMLEKSLKGCIK